MPIIAVESPDKTAVEATKVPTQQIPTSRLTPARRVDKELESSHLAKFEVSDIYEVRFSQTFTKELDIIFELIIANKSSTEIKILIDAEEEQELSRLQNLFELLTRECFNEMIKGMINDYLEKESRKKPEIKLVSVIRTCPGETPVINIEYCE
jgi:hypothetical protein